LVSGSKCQDTANRKEGPFQILFEDKLSRNKRENAQNAGESFCPLGWIWITKTVIDLIIGLLTVKYCALHAIGENIYKSNLLGGNFSGEVFQHALNLLAAGDNRFKDTPHS
jgi:hypothetical protein